MEAFLRVQIASRIKTVLLFTGTYHLRMRLLHHVILPVFATLRRSFLRVGRLSWRSILPKMGSSLADPHWLGALQRKHSQLLVYNYKGGGSCAIRMGNLSDKHCCSVNEVLRIEGNHEGGATGNQLPPPFIESCFKIVYSYGEDDFFRSFGQRRQFCTTHEERQGGFL